MRIVSTSELGVPSSSFGFLRIDCPCSSLSLNGRFAVAEPRGLEGSAALAGSTLPSSSCMHRRCKQLEYDWDKTKRVLVTNLALPALIACLASAFLTGRDDSGRGNVVGHILSGQTQ